MSPRAPDPDGASDVTAGGAEPAPRLRAIKVGSSRFATWSHHDPVTVFGARRSVSGWTEIAPTFEWLAARFSKCESYEYEVISAGASGDLAYIVGYEHTKAAVGSGPPEAYPLRVTTIFRREEGEWKVIHRHADPMLDSDSAQRHWARFDEAGPESALTP